MSDNATEYTVVVTVTVDNGDEYSSGAEMTDALRSQLSSGRRSAIAEALRELADELEAYVD